MLQDQNGQYVHPAYRQGYPTGSWFFVKVDLAPLAGKTIKDVLIDYNNGNNGVTGNVRAYFDDLVLSNTQ